jgi:RNA chaperone Hfq
MGKEFNIQNQFLNNLRKTRQEVYIQIKGDRLFQGHITAFDNYSILLKEPGNLPPVLIFKHSISYISLAKMNKEFSSIGEEF